MKTLLLLVLAIVTSKSLAQEEIKPTPEKNVPAKEIEISPEKASREKTKKISLKVFMITGGKGDFPSSTLYYSGSSYPISISYESESGFGVGIEYRNFETNRWGYQGGLEYEFAREIKNMTITGSGGTSTAAFTQKPKIRSEYVYANGLFRTGKAYFGLGVNFIFPHIDEVSATGHAGTEAIAGFEIDDQFGLEIKYRRSGLDMLTTSGSDSINYRYGTLTDLRVTLKHYF